MGIDEFPPPVLPLDDDPFVSLSVADIAAMEAALDDDEDGSDSEYEELYCDVPTILYVM
jgi:hypothetical protein